MNSHKQPPQGTIYEGKIIITKAAFKLYLEGTRNFRTDITLTFTISNPNPEQLHAIIMTHLAKSPLNITLTDPTPQLPLPISLQPNEFKPPPPHPH